MAVEGLEVENKFVQVVAMSGRKMCGSVAAVVELMVAAIGTTFVTHI